MKTLLVGNFGAQNLGDELILMAALQDYSNATVMTADASFSQQFCECDFDTVVFPPTGFKSFWQYLTSRAYRQQTKNLAKFDQIVFAGGGLFAIKLHACWLWYGVFWWLKKNNPQAEIRFEHQGVDKGLGFLGKRLARSVFKNADFVSVRDKASAQAVKNLGVMAELVSDRVWAWEEIPESTHVPARRSRDQMTLVNARKSIGSDLLQRLYRQENLVFVAFEKSDLAAVPSDWPGAVEFPQTMAELTSLCASGKRLIGERLHSLLFASKVLGSENVQLLRTPYAEKVASFAKEIGWKIF